MKKTDAIPVAVLEYAARLMEDGSVRDALRAVLNWHNSTDYGLWLRAALQEEQLPAEWYAGAADWPEPVEAAADPFHVSDQGKFPDVKRLAVMLAAVSVCADAIKTSADAIREELEIPEGNGDV